MNIIINQERNMLSKNYEEIWRDYNLRKECVEAVNFLPFLHKSIKLGYTLQGKLVHKVDNIGLSQESILEVFYSDRKCGREHKDLTICRQKAN